VNIAYGSGSESANVFHIDGSSQTRVSSIGGVGCLFTNNVPSGRNLWAVVLRRARRLGKVTSLPIDLQLANFRELVGDFEIVEA
jgi:hypothetical protein